MALPSRPKPKRAPKSPPAVAGRAASKPATKAAIKASARSGSKIAKPARSGDKRQAILEAALVLFAERGFHGTAVPEVAAAAGVAAGTLYRYFASKEALVNALYQQWKGALLSALLSDFPVDESPRQQFHELWHRLGRFANRHPQEFAFLELHHHAYLDEASLKMEQSGMQLLKSFVEQAQAEQAMRPARAELIMALVYGAFVGLLKGCAQGYLKLTPALLSTAEQLMWEAIRV